MQTVLIVIHLLIVLALVATVLLQRSEGGALGMGGGGTGGFMTGRGQANALTRATAILGGIFFVTSLGLTLFATYMGNNSSIINRQIPSLTQPAAPGAPAAPQGGNVLDQLRQLEQRSAPPAPAAPTTGLPAPATPPSAPAAPQQ